MLLSGAGPQIPKAHLHGTEGCVEDQTATNSHICNNITLNPCTI